MSETSPFSSLVLVKEDTEAREVLVFSALNRVSELEEHLGMINVDERILKTVNRRSRAQEIARMPLLQFTAAAGETVALIELLEGKIDDRLSDAKRRSSQYS
ncbi:hypothetical protein ACRQ1B_27335 [Rhizobium panacihumi]|uniref:hypothetical protein n=1 Tax=Rhizobium panacihumi TaxID=2008450 RepID=UPI003D7A0D9F